MIIDKKREHPFTVYRSPFTFLYLLRLFNPLQLFKTDYRSPTI